MALSALSKMVLNGQASDPVPVLSGVPPRISLGSGPVSHFPENIRSSVRFFADGCVLYRNIKSQMIARSFKMT